VLVAAVIGFVVLMTTGQAQSIDGPYSILSSRFHPHSSLATSRGDVYLSSAYDGSVMSVRHTDNVVSVEESLSDLFVGRLFTMQDMVFAVAGGGELLWKEEGQSRWRLIGRYDCQPFTDGAAIYVVESGNIAQLTYDGSDWIPTSVGRINAGTRVLTSFVIVNDLVVYTTAGSTMFTVARLDGTVVRAVETPSIVTNLYVLVDRSILFSSGLRVSQYLRVDSLEAGNTGYLQYKGSLLSLAYVTPRQSSVPSGVSGTFTIKGSDPREGVYTVVTPDSIVKETRLSGLVPDVGMAANVDHQWILSGSGQVAVVDSSNDVRRISLHSFEGLAFSVGVSFTEQGDPVRVGSIQMNGATQLAVFPADPDAAVQTIPVDAGVPRQLTRLVSLKNGRGIAVCDRGIYVTQGDGVWRMTYPPSMSIESRDIDLVDDEAIVCRSKGRILLFSRDQGASWDSVALTSELITVGPVVGSEHMLYAMSNGRIWAVNMDASSTTPDWADVNISLGAHQSLFASTTVDVSVVTGRSAVDPAFYPAEYTHVVCHRWNHHSGDVDSVIHQLHRPLSTSALTLVSRRDTAYVWDHLERRLIAVTFSGIVYDTTFPADSFGQYQEWTFPQIVTDNDGELWLFSSGQVVGFRLNPSTPATSSVDEYYENLYIQALRPNPVKDNATVTVGRFPSASEAGLRLYLVDITGAVVRNFSAGVRPFTSPWSTQDVPIDVGGLARGVYLLVIENAQGRSARQLIVAP